MPRHGIERKRQQELLKKPVVGYKQKGINKKIANLSLAQLRNMFPMKAHLSESELRKLAFEKMRK